MSTTLTSTVNGDILTHVEGPDDAFEHIMRVRHQNGGFVYVEGSLVPEEWRACRKFSSRVERTL